MKEGAKRFHVPIAPFSFTDGWEEQNAFEPTPLSFAEPKALEVEALASIADAEGMPDVASILRGQAAEWRVKVNSLDNSVVHDQSKVASAAVDILLGQAAAHSELALDNLLKLATQVLEGLLALASNGYRGASDVLLSSLKGATDQFNLLAHRRPDFFLHRTRSAFGIPGVISPFTEKTQDNVKLVKVLEVGKHYPHQLPTGDSGRGNQMKFQTPANYWAYRLRAYVMFAQDRAAEFARLTPEEQQRLVDEHPESPSWIEDAAMLKPLSAKTRRAWSAVIWKIVLDATAGEPEKLKVLFDLQSLPEERDSPYSDAKLRTTSNMRRQKIKEALELGLGRLVQQIERAGIDQQESSE